jgi:hypothetical protein
VKGWLALSVLVAVAALGTSTTPGAGPEDTGTPVVVDTAVGPQPGNADAVLDEDGLPPRIEYPGTLDYYCDEQGHPFGVEPDEPEAWTVAERGCLRMDIALDRAPWPGAVRP